ALGQRPGEVCDAAAEKALELGKALVKGTGNLPGPSAHALIERIDVVSQRLRHVLRALAEASDKFTAIILNRMVELGDVPRDQATEIVRVAGNLLRELGTAVIEHCLEGSHPRREHVLDGLAAVVERCDQGFGTLLERIR